MYGILQGKQKEGEFILKETEAILMSSLLGKAFPYEPVRQQSDRHQNPSCCRNCFLFHPYLCAQPHLPNGRQPVLLHTRSSLSSGLQAGNSRAHQFEFPPSCSVCSHGSRSRNNFRLNLQKLPILFNSFSPFHVNPQST